MDVKFVTGSINLGSKKTMADILADVRGAKIAKQASSEKVVKTAKVEEEKCEDCGKCPCECKEEEKKDCTAEVKIEEKKVEAKVEVKKEEKVEDKAEEKVEAKVEAKKEVVAEAKKVQFVKIAKLTAESKKFLKEFWLNIYPPEYVEAMLAEK